MKLKLFSLIALVLIMLTQGIAAEKYWQQEVHYKIDVQLDVRAKTYHGQQTILFINHSPDTLDFIWMHLYPNAYRSEDTPFARQQRYFNKSRFHFSRAQDRGYLNLTKVENNGQLLTLHFKEDAIDEVKIDLPQPLVPGDTLELKIEFEGKFPVVFSRMGTWENSYFAATQWYPKIVVYDRLGWHPDSYLDQGEFYGDYGTFDVRITLPEQYVVEATGLLKDCPQEEAFMEELADTTRYFLTLTKEARKHFIRQWIADKKANLDLNKTKTVHFFAQNVHDFAWFAGLDYFVLRKIQPSGVLTNVLVRPESAFDWRFVPEYVEKTLKFYAQKIGPYLYPKASVVQGELRAGGGMEYPMVTIVSGEPASWHNLLEIIVMHEVGHNWFMGMLGSDERASTFLDEGINSFVELKYLEHYYGKRNYTNFKKLFLGAKLLRDLGDWQIMQIMYGERVSTRTDLPLNLRAEEYNPGNYGVINYQKGALMLLALEEYLTPPIFWKGMHTYYKQWLFKHPTVTDFFKVMEQVSGKQLNWFVEEWYNSTHFCDFVIKRVEKNGSLIKVFVKNKGTMKRMPAPVRVITTKGDTLEQWWNANEDEPVIFKVMGKIKTVEVNPRHTIFETNYLNNSTAGPSIEVFFFPQIPDFEKYEIVVLPYYWYEPFVDHHRLGAMIWGGNPIVKQWFWTASGYYATASRKWAYGVSLTNRFHLPIANYSDVKFNVMDKDGLRKMAVFMKNVFQNRFQDYQKSHLIMAFETIDLYQPNYYESSMFQKAKYAVLSLQGLYAKRTLLQAFNGKFGIYKGMSITAEPTNFVKIETEARWWMRLSKTLWIELKGFWGNIWGSHYPLQESIFAGGEVDPRHHYLAFSRRGNLAPNRYFTFLQGMQMYGYTNPTNRYFVGKSGWATSLSVKFWKHLPGVYLSGAMLTTKTLDFRSDRLFAEAGFRLKFLGVNFVLPLYITDPAPGEKHLDFRFRFNYYFSLKGLLN